MLTLLPCGAWCSPLSDLAQSLQPGSSALLQTNNAHETFGAGTGKDSVFEYSNELVWDENRGTAYFLGTAHISDASPVQKFIKYDEATNTWSTLPKPSFMTSIQHAYDHHAFDPVSGRLWYTPFQLNLLRALYEYNVATGTWTKKANLPDNYVENAAAIVYFPDRGRVVLWGAANTQIRDDVWEYNPTSNSWTEVAHSINSAHQDLHGIAKYSKVKKVVWMGGGNGSNQMFVETAAGAVTPSATSPVSMNVNGTLVTDDPISGNFLVWRGTDFYEYNPTTNVWTKRSITFPWTQTGGDEGILFHTVATSLENYGVVMVAQWRSSASRVWLYRHSAGQPDPVPKAPTDLDAQ